MNIWNGKGLPAVGQICEAKNRRHGRTGLKWCRCEIIFSSEHYVILKSDEFIGQNEVVCVPKDLDFRPLKTKEQIAAEEAEKATQSSISPRRAMFTSCVPNLSRRTYELQLACDPLQPTRR